MEGRTYSDYRKALLLKRQYFFLSILCSFEFSLTRLASFNLSPNINLIFADTRICQAAVGCIQVVDQGLHGIRLPQGCLFD